MDPEAPQPQGFRNPVTIFLIVAVVAVGAYLLFFRNSGTVGTDSTSGGGGTITSGNTTVDSGAVQITVSQNPQPTPPTRKKRVHTVHHHPKKRK